jgi:hypothetical protein
MTVDSPPVSLHRITAFDLGPRISFISVKKDGIIHQRKQEFVTMARIVYVSVFVDGWHIRLNARLQEVA